MIYEISNKNTKIKINSLGAEVRSVIHNGKERAWQNESGQWAGCAILLFPFAGFNRMIYDGKDFGVLKHGFCRNEEFLLMSKTDSEIEFSLTANERTMAAYPYDFIFKVKYCLTDDGYDITYTVENPGDKSIPISSGGHESFALDSDVPNYYLEFEKEERFDFLVHDDGGFLTGEISNHGEGRVLSLEEEFTSHNKTVILGGINSRRVSLKDKLTHESVVTLSFDDYDNLLIWHPHGSRMICIEPWQCLPSYAGEIKEFKERTGVISILPKKTIAFTRKICYN